MGHVSQETENIKQEAGVVEKSNTPSTTASDLSRVWAASERFGSEAGALHDGRGCEKERWDFTQEAHQKNRVQILKVLLSIPFTDAGTNSCERIVSGW